MIRLVLLTIMLLTTVSIGYSQIFHASDTYPNGQNKFKGKFVVCSTRDPAFPFVEIFEKRKFGKWIAYNPNGTLKEIRYYTRKGKDCKTRIEKKGEWKYFNNNGILYLTEKYDNDTLVYSAIEVYEHSRRLGTAVRTYQGLEKIPPSANRDTTNLIMNPSFDQYFFKPVEIFNDGQDPIENLIPYWYSPDAASPDYYNGARKVTGVPDNVSSIIEMDRRKGYVGLMLYLGSKVGIGDLVSNSETRGFPLSTPDYKESIQARLAGTLIENRTYCFKAKILLSRNAGYFINRFGVLFSDKPVYYTYLKAPDKPTLSFIGALDNTLQWKTLCRSFIANGEEAYVTLGRFSQRDETTASRIQPDQLSELDINRSAYYLIDDLKLYEVKTPEACGCAAEGSLAAGIEKPMNFESFDEDQEPRCSRFILSNILFDSDKAELKESFIPELNELLRYLKRDESVRIMIKAFTDNEGTAEYNLKLSRKRAKTISMWLLSHGIRGHRIFAEGHGSADPIVENTSDANRVLNRRVEIVLIPD